MANWSFKVDQQGIGEYLRTDAELAAAIYERAQPPLQFAQAISPVGSEAHGDEHPGQYRDSLKAEPPAVVHDVIGGRPDARVACRLSTDVPYAPAVEKRHHVMGRTQGAFNDPAGGYGT